MVNQIKDNPKRFWNYTRHFSKSSSSIAMIEKDGVKLTNDRYKAEVLNNFFICSYSRATTRPYTRFARRQFRFRSMRLRYISKFSKEEIGKTNFI